MPALDPVISHDATSASFEVEFLAFVDRTTIWFAKRSFRNQLLFGGSRALLVVLSACLPVLISDKLTMISTPISILIAILAGFDAQFKPGEAWKHQRAAELTLRGLKRDYEHNVFIHAAANANGATPIDILYHDVSSFLNGEPQDYWRSQTTTLVHT